MWGELVVGLGWRKGCCLYNATKSDDIKKYWGRCGSFALQNISINTIFVICQH